MESHKKNIDLHHDALKIGGMRNIFTTGYLLSEPPPRPDLKCVVKNMRVSRSEKLVFAPFSEKSHYVQYTDAVYAFHGDRGLAEVLNPIRELSDYLKETDLQANKADQIYKYVLGGGAVHDNALLFKSERVLKIYDIPYRLNEYFFYIADLLQLRESVERDKYWVCEKYFDYFTSMADYLSENEEQFEKAMSRINKFPLHFEKIKKPCPLKDAGSHALYEKSHDFIFSGRLPKAMRID